MNNKIKQLNNTDAVVISDEEIKDGFVTNGIEVFKRNSMPEYTDEYANRYWQKVIATISPFKIEGLPMIELPNQEEDVEKLALGAFKAAMQFCHTDFSDTAYNRFRTWFSQNYKAAQSKQYSKSDMISAFIEGSNSGAQFQSMCEDDYEEAELCAKSDLEYFKQSLQKKQFPTAVELTEDLQVIK